MKAKGVRSARPWAFGGGWTLARSSAMWDSFLLVLLLLLVLFCGCSGPDSSSRSSLEGLDEEIAQDARVQAAQQRLRSSESRSTSSFDSVELRVRGLSVDSVDSGEGIDFIGRLRVDNPWEESRREAVMETESGQDLAQRDGTILEVQVETCMRRVEQASADESWRDYDEYREILGRIDDWNRDWAEAGTVDELSAVEIELEIGLLSQKRRPLVVVESGDASASLPGLESAAGALVVETDTVREIIESSHPFLAEARSSRERFERLSELVGAERLPWLEFVELRYETGSGRGAETLAAGIAFEIPFGYEESSEEQRYEGLAQSELFRSQALLRELELRVNESLLVLSDFEARVGELRALSEQADEADELAARWLESRSGDPGGVARLLDSSYRARELLTEQRARAGRASCELLAASAVRWRDWPRKR